MKCFLVSVTLLCCLIAASCTKEATRSATSTYTFINCLPERITLDVYETQEDYNTNSRRGAQYIIEPGNATPVVLNNRATYWVDWYSAGYSYNNWSTATPHASQNDPFPLPAIAVADEDDHYTVSEALPDTARSVLIGAGTESAWQLTITDDPALAGTHRFVFRKGFGGTYTFTRAGGEIITRDFSFYTLNYSSSPGFSRFEMQLTGKADGIAFCLIDWDAGAGGRDTMLITQLGQSSFHSYSLARQ